MARFRYKAASASGEVLEGEIEALSQEAVVRRLQSQGHIPIAAEEVGARSATSLLPQWRRRRVRGQDVAIFTTELASLLESGLALDRALDLLATLSEGAPIGGVVARLQADVRRGLDLSEALQRYPDVFSPFYLNMVRAGEASGALELALSRLAEFLERSRELRETVVSALIYPAIVVAFAAVSIAVILGFVIPRISALFTDAGQALPWMTQLVVAAGAFVHDWWWALVIGSGALYAYCRRRLRDPAERAQWDRRMLAMPLLGALIGKLEAARFTRTLGTLLRAGVPLLDAIAIAREVIGNQVVARGVSGVATRVRQGQGLAKPLMDAGVFPGLAVQLVQVGEQTGNLEEMLLRVADIYDREVRTSVKRAIDVMVPLLILGLAVLIAGIILSVLVAVLGVNELAF